MLKLAVPLVVAFWQLSNGYAYPGGAGTCPPEKAAPLGAHGAAPPEETLLTARGFQFTAESPLIVGQETVLSLISSSDEIPFRGFLIRMTTGDGEFVEPNGPLVQMAAACGDVPGVTHTSRDSKTSVEATVIPMAAGPMLFDVSVVEFNSAQNGNVFSYSSVEFQVADAEKEETAELAAFPTLSPKSVDTAGPTLIPTAVQTAEPTVTPTLSTEETSGPTMPPVSNVPTASPVGTAAIVSTPPVMDTFVVTKAPVMAPTNPDETSVVTVPPVEPTSNELMDDGASKGGLSSTAGTTGLTISVLVGLFWIMVF